MKKMTSKNKKQHKYTKVLCSLIILLSIVSPLWATASAGKLAETAVSTVLNTLVEITFGTAFRMLGTVTGWVGKLLDMSIEYSIRTPELFTEGIVQHGWNICRDLANLGFVFILIFIGIATILQLQTYSYKRLLVRIIVVALLVNFSMTVTLIVIDASNLVTMQLLCKATDGGCRAANLSLSIVKGMSVQSTVGDPNASLTETIDAGKAAMVYSLGSVLLLIAAFVVGAGAVLFLIRTVVLMILVIFSPLAFVAMAIGSSLAKKWWSTLLNQAFFAPIYMFFIYLVVSWFNSPSFKALVNPDGHTFHALIVESSPDYTMIVGQFALAGVLLLGSLVAAKQMGAYGAAGAISLGNKMRKSATGYAGNISKRGAVAATGGAAQKVAESKAMQTMASIPLFGKATRPLTLALNKVSKEKEKGDDAKVKSYLNMAPGSLASVASTLSPQMREKVFRQAEEEQMGKTVGKMDKDTQLKMGRSLKDDQVRNKFARATKDLETGAKIAHRTDTLNKDQVGEYYDTLKGTDVSSLNLKKIDVNNQELMKGFLSKVHANDLQNTMKSREKIIDFSATMNAWMSSQGKPTDMFGDELEKLGNEESAKYFRTSPGKKILSNPKDVIVKKTQEKKK